MITYFNFKHSGSLLLQFSRYQKFWSFKLSFDLIFTGLNAKDEDNKKKQYLLFC
jgi:hypothetical protein